MPRLVISRQAQGLALILAVIDYFEVEFWKQLNDNLVKDKTFAGHSYVYNETGISISN